MVSDLLPEPMTSSYISDVKDSFLEQSCQRTFVHSGIQPQAGKDRPAWIAKEKLTIFAKGFMLVMLILSHRIEEIRCTKIEL
jgi:hypothetical protein